MSDFAHHRKLGVLVAVLAAVFLIPALAVEDDSGEATSAPSFWRYVDKDGNIARPKDAKVRRHWVHLGSWTVPKVKGSSGPGMHDVYAENWAVKAFNRDHQWPDGAVLVKQIHAIHEGALTTGPTVYWSGKTGAWFVMIKDRKNRFPSNRRWGQGWGWALFKADKPDTNVNKDWKQGGLSNCYACHVPAKNTDWVYLEGYPVLELTATQKKSAAQR